MTAGDLKLRRTRHTEPRRPGRRGPASWLQGMEGVDAASQWGGQWPPQQRPGLRVRTCLSDTGQMLVGGSTVEGGWGRGSYGLESQGLESVASLSSPTAFFFQSLGYTSFTITCSAALGGPHRASDWPLIIFQEQMNDNVWGLRRGHGTCQGLVACAFELWG